MERTAATFNSPYKQGRQVMEDREPHQCVLLRAGGHMSVLDMEQGGAPTASRFDWVGECPCVALQHCISYQEAQAPHWVSMILFWCRRDL